MKIKYLPLLICLCFSFTMKGQILKKLKEKVQEVAKEVVEETEKDIVREVVPCELDDKNCIETAKSEGKKVVITNKESVENNTTETQKLEYSEPNNQYEKNTQIEIIGNLNKTNDFILSEDGSHIAIPGFKGSRQTFFINGKEDSAFDKVHFKSFKFSSTGSRYAYIASNGSDNFAVINGEIAGKIPPTNLNFSEKILTISDGGENVSFFQKRADGSATLVINGQELPNIQLPLYSELFYLKGKNIYFVGSPYNGIKQDTYDPSNTYHLYINNKPGPAYQKISNLMVSDDGVHYAYQASKMVTGDKYQEQVILNGKGGTPYPKIENLIMDPLTGAIFYIGVSEERLSGEKGFYRNYYEADYVFKDRKYKRSETGMVRTSEITFSPNGKRHAFIAEDASGMYKVWVDGKSSLNYEKVGKPIFTGDNQTVIFQATTGGQNFVVVNGKEFGPFKYLDRIIVSETGSSYAFLAGEGNDRNYYVNGKLSGPGDYQTELYFSPDGTRYAYFNNQSKTVVIDGTLKSHMPYKFSDISGSKARYTGPLVVFSPKGNHVAYLTRTLVNNQYLNTRLILDEKELDIGNNQITFPTFSPDGKHFAYIQSINMTGGPRKWQLYIDMKPGPIIGDDKFTGMDNTIQFVDNETLQVIGFKGEEVKKYTVSL